MRFRAQVALLILVTGLSGAALPGSPAGASQSWPFGYSQSGIDQGIKGHLTTLFKVHNVSSVSCVPISHFNPGDVFHCSAYNDAGTLIGRVTVKILKGNEENISWKPVTSGSGSGTSPPATAASGPRTTFGNGDWIPGKTVAAGTYYAEGGASCHWDRASSLGASGASVLAADRPAGQSIVTIAPTDAEFQTQGCGTWTPLAASGPRETSFGNGEYAVGIEIAPGTYSAPGGRSCHWQSDRNFTHTAKSVIAAHHPSGESVVVIASSVVMFVTAGCGTWTMQ